MPINRKIPAGLVPLALIAFTLNASAETIAYGKALYSESCKFCHGFDGVTRVGSSVPDLRYASEEVHATWNGIVIGGARRANGMPSADIEAEPSEALRLYLLSLSEELRER